MGFKFPLMNNNITREDLDVLIEFLKGDPRLTQSANVRAFEEEWSRWLGVRYSVFVNSGASSNLVTMAALRQMHGGGEIIVPTLTWVSDIASVLQNGFTPVFVDIDPQNLCMDVKEVIARLTPRTRAVFITHVQGFNGLTAELLRELDDRGVLLIEDVCEAHGATYGERKLGSVGYASNFSFYFAHHMSTIEGGMVCTDDRAFYERIRMLRSHGMVREADDPALRERYVREHPDLNPDFIFACAAYNVRSTEIGGVLGRSQLRRLDADNAERRRNFKCFLANLSPERYRVDFDLEGSCNYAFPLVLKEPDPALRDRLEEAMRQGGVEFRRGSSGGGNQLRQPYLKGRVGEVAATDFPEVEHIHFYGYYIGNYPGLGEESIEALCAVLNGV